MKQAWFEMADVRKRRLENAVWIPLRATRSAKLGQYGYVGYQQDFYGVGTLAVPLAAKDKAAELKWMNIGNNDQMSHWDRGRYIPCDVFEFLPDRVAGLLLVLQQRTNREEIRNWHLHQDFVFAFKLKRENDVWVAADEGYTEVARLGRDSVGSPSFLEVKAEFLRDYLCARGLALRVSSYRYREEIVEAPQVDWGDEKEESSPSDRWLGRVIPIHEGGNPFGTKMQIFHVARNDVDVEEDVPKFDFPTDEQVIARSWTKESGGRKLFLIRDELWRNEWIDPGKQSPRIKGDKISPTAFFITDASGKTESRETLAKESRWLWFRPEVMLALTNTRGGGLGWGSRDTGGVSCSPDYWVTFGINKLGLVNVYAKDIGELPDWQQRIWAGFNISPDGGVSDELLKIQMEAMPPATEAPEAVLRKAYYDLNDAATKVLGEPLFREHAQHNEIMKRAHRFRAVNSSGLYELAKDLARLTADSIDVGPLQRVAPPPKGENWASLKSLEKVVAKVVGPEEARSILSGLVGIYELRLADAHLPGNEIEEALQLAKVDQQSLPIFQGYQLIDTCVASLYKIADTIKNLSKNENQK